MLRGQCFCLRPAPSRPCLLAAMVEGAEEAAKEKEGGRGEKRLRSGGGGREEGGGGEGRGSEMEVDTVLQTKGA